MGVITELSAQVKDKTRCSVFVDGRFCCGLSLQTVMQNRLKVGMQISVEELSRIQLESEKSVAFDKALSYISLSQKTEKQIVDHLTGKGYLPEVVDEVLEKLRGYNFVNDGQYATAYANQAISRKGRRLVKMELKQKGVAENAIEEALGEVDLEKEEEGARRIAEKYLKNKPMDKPNLQKAFRYMMGKGYDYELIKSVLSALSNTELDDD